MVRAGGGSEFDTVVIYDISSVAATWAIGSPHADAGHQSDCRQTAFGGYHQQQRFSGGIDQRGMG